MTKPKITAEDFEISARKIAEPTFNFMRKRMFLELGKLAKTYDLGINGHINLLFLSLYLIDLNVFKLAKNVHIDTDGISLDLEIFIDEHIKNLMKIKNNLSAGMSH